MVARIKQLLDWQQLSPTQFADRIGVGRPVVSHILSERNKPSLEVVQRIIAAFPGLSLSWLLSGVGDMLAEVTAAPPAVAAAVPAPPVAPAPELSPLPAFDEPVAQPDAVSPLVTAPMPNQPLAALQPAGTPPEAVTTAAAPGAARPAASLPGPGPTYQRAPVAGPARFRPDTPPARGVAPVELAAERFVARAASTGRPDIAAPRPAPPSPAAAPEYQATTTSVLAEVPAMPAAPLVAEGSLTVAAGSGGRLRLRLAVVRR